MSDEEKAYIASCERQTEGDEYIEILQGEAQRATPAHSVMLPRALRSQGRVFVSDRPTFVSTIFFIFPADGQRSRLLASWKSTVFFQLECEVYGNNRRGLRKLEKADYEPLHVPHIANLGDEQRQAILQTPVTEFVNLRQPQPRAIDGQWAVALWGEEYAKERLAKARGLLAILVAGRER